MYTACYYLRFIQIILAHLKSMHIRYFFQKNLLFTINDTKTKWKITMLQSLEVDAIFKFVALRALKPVIYKIRDVQPSQIAYF